MSNIRCTVIHRLFLLVLYIPAVPVRIAEVEHIYRHRHMYLLHPDIFKCQIGKYAAFASAASGLDAHAAVGLRENALLHKHTAHTAGHFGAYGHGAVSAL